MSNRFALYDISTKPFTQYAVELIDQGAGAAGGIYFDGRHFWYGEDKTLYCLELTSSGFVQLDSVDLSTVYSGTTGVNGIMGYGRDLVLALRVSAAIASRFVLFSTTDFTVLEDLSASGILAGTSGTNDITMFDNILVHCTSGSAFQPAQYRYSDLTDLQELFITTQPFNRRLHAICYAGRDLVRIGVGSGRQQQIIDFDFLILDALGGSTLTNTTAACYIGEGHLHEFFGKTISASGENVGDNYGKFIGVIRN